jgi:hypothetical protein
MQEPSEKARNRPEKFWTDPEFFERLRKVWTRPKKPRAIQKVLAPVYSFSDGSKTFWTARRTLEPFQKVWSGSKILGTDPSILGRF